MQLLASQQLAREFAKGRSLWVCTLRIFSQMRPTKARASGVHALSTDGDQPSARALARLATSTAVDVLVESEHQLAELLELCIPKNGGLHKVGESQFRACWHDTVDMTLTTSQLSLRSSDDGPSTLWELRHAQAGKIQTSITDVATHFAGDMPTGELRSLVEKHTGRRPVLAHLEAGLQSETYQLIDSEQKTIGMLVIEHAVPKGGTRWITARLQSVRGYESHVRRVAKAFERLGQTSGISRFDIPLLQVLGKDRDRRSARRVRLKRDETARGGLTKVLAPIASDLRALLPPTVADLDPEFLHDLRVAIRRTRSALSIAHGALGAEEIRRFVAGFAWFGEITGRQRELDVFLINLPQLVAQLPDHDAARLGPFRNYLRVEREREHAILQRHLRSPRLEHLLATWERLLVSPAPLLAAQPTVTIGELSATRKRELVAEFCEKAQAVTDKSPESSLHDLRKLGKRLRYSCEMFASLDAAGTNRLLKPLRAMQDYLGAFQDLCDQRDGLVDCAHGIRAADGPTSAILAIGKLTGILDGRAAEMRAEYPLQIERFLTALAGSGQLESSGAVA